VPASMALPRDGRAVKIAACLDRLDEAIDAAATLGIDTSAAAAVRDTARQRLGFPSEAYVLALAGGTGVGKSSLLNALAGGQVSPAGVRRPTTGQPVAWIPTAYRSDLAQVLDWLGVTEIREHDDPRPGAVAVLDLPDLDSIAPEHRARVDELLPRLDAVAWVADPEKYQDALLHDEYLRRWAPRLDRQLIVLNKSDRVGHDDAERLRADLARQLRGEGLGEMPVALASSVDGEAGIEEVRRWLGAGVEAKRIVTGRIAADVRAAAADLAARAGIDPAGRTGPLISPARRAQAERDVTREVLGVIDLPGLERQAVAATRLAARPRGGGPMGGVTAAIYRFSGREQVAADPSGYLRRWRQRGSLARAVEPLRRLLAETIAAVPPAARPGLAAVGEPGPLQERLAEAVDQAVASQANDFRAPRSAVWWLIGLGQYLVTALLIFAALWFITLYIGDGTAVATVDLPLLGPVPQPTVFLALVLAAGYLLARSLGLHAGWVGRRAAGRLRDAVSEEVRGRLATTTFAALDALEAARARLATATHAIVEGCRPEGSADPEVAKPG
jgi:GTP-binding protein EngB required for normal cell division